MGKNVYLFELDSVRNTDQEIMIGQTALYNEIVSYGHTVVMTFNQFVDSRGFFSLLSDKNYYDNIISLFESGGLKISQYGGIRSLAQYLIYACDYDRTFIFAGWPLKSTQKRLIALIKRSLTFSDLSEIGLYIDGKRNSSELKDLFVENVDGKIENTALKEDIIKDILIKLKCLLQLVLRISPMESIYMPPRNESEYKNKYEFKNLIKIVTGFNSDDLPERWTKAVKILDEIHAANPEENTRSAYQKRLKELSGSDGKIDKMVYQYAEAIVDLCYNYANEISICNISKHYNVDDILNGNNEHNTFKDDFFARLNILWDLGDYDNRFLLDENNKFEKYVPSKNFPDFSIAAQIDRYIKDGQRGMHSEYISGYEDKLEAERKNRKKCIFKTLCKHLKLTICVLMVTYLIYFILNSMYDFVSKFALANVQSCFAKNLLEAIIFPTLFLTITEGVTVLISKKFSRFKPLSKLLENISTIFNISRKIGKRRNTYTNPCMNNSQYQERASTSAEVDYSITRSLRKYKIYRQNNQDSILFSQSDGYKLVDVNDPNVIKALIRLEELYNYHFGIVYRSKYNILCVDPVIPKEKDKKAKRGQKGPNYTPYERIIPAAGNGAVIVPIYKGKFVLLKQYRHATRKVQWAFPRGHSKLNEISEEIAVRELEEELNISRTSIKSTVYIGEIAPDSGLTSSKVSVYYSEISDYSRNTGHEGIIDIKDFTEEEFENLIQNKNNDDFNDGFTLAAYVLYKIHKDSSSYESSNSESNHLVNVDEYGNENR